MCLCVDIHKTTQIHSNMCEISRSKGSWAHMQFLVYLFIIECGKSCQRFFSCV